MIVLLVASAHALTLAQAVDRAAAVNPEAIVAGLEVQRAQLDAAERWAGLGPTPELSVSREFAGGAETGKDKFKVTFGVLDAQRWMDAAGHSAEASALRYARAGTTLDAQYAAAALYVGAYEAGRAVEAARQQEQAAKETATLVAGRVKAGLDSELVGRSAEAAVLVARAERVQAEADEKVARLHLARALEMDDPGTLEAPPVLVLPEAGTAASPWLDESAQAVRAARWQHAEAIAGWLPKGGLEAKTDLDPMAWSVTLSATWALDGVAGPFLAERRSALAVRIAETQYAALKRDYAEEQAVAVEQARAAHDVREAQEARAALAQESVAMGQVQLTAGVTSAIALLRLSDDQASASKALVAAELDEAVAILEARRLAGEAW